MKKLAARDFEDLLQVCYTNHFSYSRYLLFSVLNSRFRWPTRPKQQHNHHGSPLRARHVAWTCQTPASHRIDRPGPGEFNHPTGHCASQVPVNDLRRVCDTQPTIWGSRSRTPESRQSKAPTNYGKIEIKREGAAIERQEKGRLNAKGFWALKLQNPCPTRLCEDDPRVWNYGWL